MFGGRKMDGFMDKLTQRFGTQDVIRVNSEAEAKELEASRTAVKEYEKILSEIKRLNLKTVETNEMTAQLVQASLEKLNQYQAQPAGEAKDNSEEIAAIKTTLEEENAAILDALKEQGEFIHKENVRVYRNVQVSIVDELKLQTEALATQNADLKKQVKSAKSVAVTSLVFNIISTLCLIGSAIYVILTMVD